MATAHDKMKSLKFSRDSFSNDLCLTNLLSAPTNERMFKGAYIGIKDSKGRDIHEGDVLFTGNFHTMYEEYEIVTYKYGGFYPFAIHGWECTLSCSDVEVMFSIYD